jgi:hypothetical protein
MRIRMLRRPRQTCIDGVCLDRFEPGFEYEVGTSLAALFFAEGWAEPVPFGEPDHTVPLTDRAPDDERRPPNLMREKYPPYADTLGIAHDIDRRRRRRTVRALVREASKRPPSR